MRCWFLRTAAGLLLLSVSVGLATAGHRKKQDEEPKPQVLPLPRELPRAISTDPRNLSFRVTPLLTTGHLSSQIRDTVSSLIRDTKGASIVKVRAFVAGAGDSRRVQEIVSGMFSDKRATLPVLTIVQVGALGKDSAAVVMEAVISERKAVNPGGLALVAAQPGASMTETAGQIGRILQKSGIAAAEVVSTTCFASTLSNYDADRSSLSAAFPNSAINLVQALRDPAGSNTSCEAIARLKEGTPAPPPSQHDMAFLNSPEIVLTGLQLSFGTYLDDADSALSHLQRDVATVHADVRDMVLMNAFSVNPAAVSALEKTMPKFNLPRNALRVQPVEGLPSLDAALGMEAILVPASSSQARISRAAESAAR